MRAHLETFTHLLVVVSITCYCGVLGEVYTITVSASSTWDQGQDISTNIILSTATTSNINITTGTDMMTTSSITTSATPNNTVTSTSMTTTATTTTNTPTTNDNTTSSIITSATPNNTFTRTSMTTAATTTTNTHTNTNTGTVAVTTTTTNDNNVTSTSNASNIKAITGGVIGAIFAVVITVLIIFIGIYYFFIYKRRNDKADDESGAGEGAKDDNNNDDDDVAKICFSNPFSRLELPHVFNQVCACLNCHDDNTVILNVTNAIPDDLDKFEVTLSSPKSSGIEALGSGEVDDEDIAHSKFEKPHKLFNSVESNDYMNTEQRYIIRKPPDEPAPMPNTLPRLPEKGIVSKPFGVHPYAVVNLEKLIGKTTSCEADAKRNPLDLPPKPKQKTPAPSQTATADDVPQESSNKLRQYNSAPLQASPDTSTPAESTESDSVGDTNNADTSNDDGTNEEKQFTYADLQNLPDSDKFIVTDDAFVNYAEIK